MALLEINDLRTFFTTKRGIIKAVNGVSYTVESGRTLGVVGESGSGKSVFTKSFMGAFWTRTATLTAEASCSRDAT